MLRGPGLGAIAFLALGAALGAGSGAAFALLLAPANKVGSVTGVTGGLGGFVPPLVMGSLYGAYDSYAVGLAAVAAAALAFTGTGVRHALTGAPRRGPAEQNDGAAQPTTAVARLRVTGTVETSSRRRPSTSPG
ncbi:putative nitrate/nitrite transporter NarK2 [Streptomyces cyanogenus]|uniref:Nitrate/nitrite transporter NarK2 n=1 Tax=Streptomyces cyanogenus TaxID=80860 RepID=A0ABX7U2R4_STRCY|nr:hypothetical protein [Streptomyces cyanogenus]QTE02429.1 putative nitrate/nitrite transporter NarK2 [Streptomyces cyanogenus]